VGDLARDGLKGGKMKKELTELLSLRKENKSLMEYEAKFVRHIESHLIGEQVPVCKICGKTILEIADE
jgi:hypothetical protein